MIDPRSNNLVIYDTRIRWLAALNLSVSVACIYLSQRSPDASVRYLTLVFFSLYSLFWIRDLIYGFPLRLVSNGRILQWQDGKDNGSATLTDIKRISVGVQSSRGNKGTNGGLSWTYIRLHMADGKAHELPPNLAQGLNSRNWRHMRMLVAHIRKVTSVSIVPLDDPKRGIKGVKTELFDVSPNTR